MTGDDSAQTIPKITAFVTREKRSIAEFEILVFQHPDAGTQFPAGTVELGETFEVAALREVAEETGLTDTRLVNHLGTVITELDAVKAIVTETCLRKGPSCESESLATLPRGYWCHILTVQGDFSEVRYEELNFNTSPPGVVVRFTGWVRSEFFADRMARGFFHIHAGGSSPERWIQRAESRFDFECFWIPLVPKPVIDSPQQEWIDDNYEALMKSLRQ